MEPPYQAVGWLLLTIVGFGCPSPADAQGKRADYQRSARLRERTANKVFRDRVEPNWSADGNRFWYRVRTAPERHEFVLVDAEQGTRVPAFDHERLAAALQAAGVRQSAERLMLDQLEWPPDEPNLEFRCGGRRWSCDLQSYALRELPGRVTEPGSSRSLQATARGPKSSRRTGPETEVTFVNRTVGNVELYWLDPDGKRRSYGRLQPGEERSQHTYAGHVWLLVDEHDTPLGVFEARERPTTVDVSPAVDSPADNDTANVEETNDDERERGKSSRRRPNSSPDGQWSAFVRDDNVWLRHADSGEEIALSADGTSDYAYSGRFFWSPDSSMLVAVRTQAGEERTVHYIESSPADQVQPKLHSHTYAKPGDRIRVDRPQLFRVADRTRIPVSEDLAPNPWSITGIRWEPDSSRFTFVYNQRGHQCLRLLSVAAADGAVRSLIDEQSSTFINYSGNFYLKYLDETQELIWMSERDGWNHLYLYDACSGTLRNQITCGEWVVRGVDEVDEGKRQIWFRAGGIRPEQDPYFVHFGRIGFDGAGLVILTEGDGTHAIEFSPDRRFLLDRYSRVDMPPVTELRRTDDGQLVCEVERANWEPLLQTGWQPPERFTAKGRDGETDIFGVIYRPTTFDAQRKYPIIENIYAGPQDSFVPKGFRAFYAEQALAELGFVVAKIDGMGTANRSKKFHDVCWQNLKDAGLPDRIRWIQAAAERRPYMDLERVGIYGGSAGGQSAAGAVMMHGDFYKVAVADCGCHDNRMDKIWWNEQWMGWPVGPHYAANSNVTLAPGLTGKLLLIVGEMDTNVDPASTMQVVNALIKADKDFDLLVMPGVGHGAAERPYASRRRADYFVRHLLGVEPRAE